MRGLVVEDCPRNARTMARFLRAKGVTVDVAHDAAEARSLLEDASYGLALIDWMLPLGRGTDLVRVIRSAGSRMAIVMMSGYAGAVDRVEALESGADDFMSKPLDCRELWARISLILRRGALAWDAVLLVGDVELRLDGAYRHGRSLGLANRELRLLRCLARHEGRALTRDELLADVWDSTVGAASDTVDTHVHRLRPKLDETSLRIETVRGIGYRLVLERG